MCFVYFASHCLSRVTSECLQLLVIRNPWRVPTKCGAVRICWPTKAALWLVESGPQIVAVVSAVAVSQQDAWESGLHAVNDRYTVRRGPVGIWRIYRGPVGFCRSPAGPFDLADPLFYRCLFTDLLRIDGGPVDRFGGSSAGPLDFADPLRARWI